MFMRYSGMLCRFSVCCAVVLGAGVLPAQDFKVEKVADGLGFPEGPVWHPDGFLLFSDIHGATIQQLKPEGGSVPWFNEGKQTNGLILSNDRTKIYACCHSERELLEIDAKTKKFRVLAKEPLGKPLNHVNDVAVDPDGNIFFTDPKWGAKPGDVQGVYCTKTDGNTTLAVQLDRQPNGIVISPDKRWVYVGRHGADDIWRFSPAKEGRLVNGSKWVDLGPGAGPDGMTVDSRGNLYVAQAGNGKICILSPEGKVLQRIPVHERMSTNCEFETGNENVLYVTGDGKADQKVGTVFKVTFARKPGT
jgi:sugar lactone lactonase YvrE